MSYLIMPCSFDLDSIISAYIYYEFIQIAGFDVKFYIDKKLDSKIKSILKDFKYTTYIAPEDNIVILSNDKFIFPKHIDKNRVTEIISLCNNDFTEFIDANIKLGYVSLLVTLIIERYREYQVKLSQKAISLLMELYNEEGIKLTDRDRIACNYIKLLYEDIQK